MTLLEAMAAAGMEGTVRTVGEGRPFDVYRLIANGLTSEVDPDQDWEVVSQPKVIEFECRWIQGLGGLWAPILAPDVSSNIIKPLLKGRWRVRCEEIKEE